MNGIRLVKKEQEQFRMKYRKKPWKLSRTLWVLTGMLLLSGCDYKEQGNIYNPATMDNATATVSVEPLQALPSILPTMDGQTLEIEAYWKGFAPQILYKDSLYQEFEEKPLRYYEEGLRNIDPIIRWYCTYKITEYAELLSNFNHQTIDAMLEDPDSDVQKAASFAKGLLDNTFKGEAFERSANGKVVAYYKYREARYNDGKVYLVRDGVTKLIYKSPSVTLLTISPNSRFLFIESGGRIWTDAQVTDLTSDKVVSIPDLVMDIIRDAKNGYNTKMDPSKIERFDAWVHFKEWSPGGDRLLYSYQFTDEKRDIHAGYAVLDLNQGKIMKVYPRKYEHNPLEDFSWNTN
jgi:hypothetical protein